MICRVAIAAMALALSAPLSRAANWTVARVNHTALPSPAGEIVEELSGVTYVGPAGDAHRFLAAAQTHGYLAQFDVAFSPGGAIAQISHVVTVDIAPTDDFEGIAYTNSVRHTAFLSEENHPGVVEVNLDSGTVEQTIAVPAAFTAHKRGNRGFESLTRTPDSTVMWTANEEALTVDGPASSPTAPTTVRLLRFDVSGEAVAAGSQYAYEVEPIHGSIGVQSGLADLVAMPDGTLLALERSAAVTSPLFLNRVFEIDLAGATDVSVGSLADGLIGQAYTPVGKMLMWSGAADGGLGQNLEGLALGPRLQNGAWALLGVVDNAGGSGNTIVAFTATAVPSADVDDDGDGDGADFLLWQRGLGKAIGAQHADGDADRDGDVDGADLDVWKAAGGGPLSAPEPTGAVVLVLPGVCLLQAGRQRSTR
jgi:hypothetical protein